MRGELSFNGLVAGVVEGRRWQEKGWELASWPGQNVTFYLSANQIKSNRGPNGSCMRLY